MRFARFKNNRIAAWLLPAVVLACCPGFARAEDDLPEARTLIREYIDALGGQAAMRKLQNRVTEGTFEIPAQGLKGTITTYNAEPQKMYTFVEIPNMMTMKQGTADEFAWRVHSMVGPQILTGQEKEATLREATFNNILYWRKLYKDAEVVGREQMEGEDYYKLKMTSRGDMVETWYIDTDTHLVRRVDTTMSGMQGTMTVEAYIEEYKEFDGVKIPVRMRQKIGPMTQIVEITSVKHNVDVPADTFEVPEEIQKLRKKSES